jgi:LPXTG-motif cell wall-anchored protein
MMNGGSVMEVHAMGDDTESGDYTKPTLIAAVSNGVLSITANDDESGVRAIYVNGYEFDNIEDGKLSIRLQQFDADYECFTIQAEDNAGNMSDVYKTDNPYFSDEEAVAALPTNAEATEPTSATGRVTEHVDTDSDGNEIKQDTESGSGREFYTIQTAGEKVFYLIINRDDETVYFLTEISENDLLNATTDNSETLPKNSAAIDSVIPVSGPSPNVKEGAETDETEAVEEGETEKATQTEEAPQKNDNPIFAYAIMGIAGLAVAGGVYLIKKKKKKEDFVDEDEDDDEYDDEYGYDDEPTDSDEEFFEDNGVGEQ